MRNPIHNNGVAGKLRRCARGLTSWRYRWIDGYFNRDWRPIPFAEMADWLEAAKVSYVCSAAYLDHMDGLNLTAEQQQFLAEIPDPMFRQSVRGFLVNRQFRRDYWVKGPTRLSALRQGEILRQQAIALTTPASEFTAKVTGALGEADINGSLARPLVDLLADHRPRTIGEMKPPLAAGKRLRSPGSTRW